MIKAESKGGGVAVALYGGIMEVLEEFIALTSSLRERLKSELPDHVADELIAMCGKLAYTNDEDEMNAIVSEVEKVLEDKIKDLEARG